MPYEWLDTQSEDGRRAKELHLWPYRSLPKKGFVWFVGGTIVTISVPLFAVIGTAVLWGLLPFLALAVWALWAALNRSYRDGEILEELVIQSETVNLTRHDPNGRKRDWEANPYWIRVEMHPKGGPVENYLTLNGGARVVEIGAFLTPPERQQLYGELIDAIKSA